MAKIKKKEVRKSVEDALYVSLAQLELSSTSKKMKKAIRDAAKIIGDQLADELKKSNKSKRE